MYNIMHYFITSQETVGIRYECFGLTDFISVSRDLGRVTPSGAGQVGATVGVLCTKLFPHFSCCDFW